MKILAISGGLRVASLNSALLRAVARLAPADISVVLYRGLGGARTVGKGKITKIIELEQSAKTAAYANT